MTPVPARSTCTPEEYLAYEREAPTRHELVNGHILARSGASRAHNLVALNIASELRAALKGRSCETYHADLRVKVAPTGLYTYPDVVVVCGKPSFEDGHVDTLLDPTVIFEVLSPSTEAYDRGEKFAHYRRLESLREYWLAAQDRVRLERYVRQGDQWVLTEHADPAAVVEVEAVGCRLALADVYERVDFATAERAVRPAVRE